MRKAVRNLGGPYNIPLLGGLQLAYGITPKNVFDKPTELRKIITPAFYFKILEEFSEVLQQRSEILVDCLASKANGEMAFDIYPLVCSATLDIIVETAMGTKVGAQTGGTKRYTQAVTEMTNMLGWRFLQVHLKNEVIFSILHSLKKLQSMKNLRIMYEFTHNVIKERRNTLEASVKKSPTQTIEDIDLSDIGTRKRMALLDVLLQSTTDGESLTDEDIHSDGS
ncbi:cytochrome P450 4d8-like [Musca vetustissima]|uniref:cytochrome P450 4d8-like n=1 Tax=Musca vetustissima TaxID=27455 RepID=UPI002AB7B963|nr:cytochrome P450 4d8-like [Musca vetustissima]